MIRKTIIVTGASGGIGGATAYKFAKEGYNVALVYNKNKPTEIEKKIKELGVETLSVKIDISKEKEVISGFEKIFNHFDIVDCLACVAGIAESETLLIDKTESDISKVIDTNLKGTIFCNREVVKYFLKKKKGCIINVSSILGKNGCSGEVVYSSSKAGVIGLTKALSKEVGEFGIRVNAVAPGMIKTKMTSCFTEKECKILKENTSLKRLGEPEDIADVIYFLATDSARFITGECIEVSGGLLI